MVKDWDTSANRHVPDSTMTCCIPTPTPPCCLTLTLSGEAKELHGRLEGTYIDTGLVSMGRPVIILLLISFVVVISFLVGVQVQELPPVCGNRGYPLEHPAEL